jgi:hypothetical protein
MPYSSLHVNTTIVSPVKRKMRDPLEFLAQKRQISSPQYCAGLRLQLAFEVAGRGGLQSPDPGRVVVDGGRGCFEPAAKRLRACGDLVLARKKLEADGFALLRDVLERGLFLKEAAFERGLCAERAQRKLNKRFRESLDIMASAFSAPNTMAA